MAELDFDYRSINRRPTALGIDRSLCIIGVMFALIRFHIPAGRYPLLESVAIFAVWWTLIFGLTKWEPRILGILRDVIWQKRHYSALKVRH